MKRVLSLIILATSALIAQPQSDVPSNMAFQGLLTDTEGIAYDDGEYQLTFRLIREMNNGTEQTVWEESHLTNVTNGVFSVVLGSENPLPLNIPPNVLLETQVGDEILSPRQPLTSVPFALKSSRSQQAYQSVISDTANFAHNAQLATHADTANFVMNLPMVDSVMFSEQAHNSMYADTAQFVAQAQSALTSLTSENSTNAVYADTASFVLNGGGATNLNGLSDALVEANSLYIGEDPSSTTTGASYNVSVGITAMENITSGAQNVAVGFNALEENTTGERNVGIGYQALENTSTGSQNTAVGRTSLPFNTSGDGNTALGDFTLYSNSTGDDNVAIGRSAGQHNTTGSSNVFIGKGAGADISYQTVSNKLVIANSNTSTPLIDGDFEAATLKVNGSLEVTGSMTMSVADVITESTTFNGSETIIPVNTDGTITIDSDQLVQGRILIFKSMSQLSQTFELATEGVEQIQSEGNNLSNTINPNGSFGTMRLFSDGSNWYEF
jgi:hypothetical protein